ncbi:MAG TPA: peptidylprolyl isomerase [Candidatus Binataceae bacterium]|nr:peptidylprolyl isomerase [Candidatus Binataceae bacterium]
MLEGIRKHSYSFGTRLLLVLLVLPFALFFGTSVGSFFTRVKPVATINCRQFAGVTWPGCQQILAGDVDHATVNIRNTVNNLYGDKAPQVLARMNVRETAIEQLIDQKLIENEAKRIGLSIGDDALEQTIESQTAFQANGRFDVARYQQLLRANDLEPAVYESETRAQMLNDTMHQMVTHATQVSTAEDRSAFDQFAIKLALSYITIPYTQFIAGINPTDQEVAKFYTQNKEIFREPERVKIAFIRYDPAALAVGGEPSEQDIQNFYDDNAKTMFTHPAEVHASHILVAVPAGASQKDKDAAHAKAENILKQLQAGANFATLAKKYSDDPGTKNNGGDLGSFPRGEMVKPFEEAAFSLKPGQLTIVETQFGFHILKVLEIKEAGTDAPEQVRSRIITELKKKAGVEMGKADVQQDLTAALTGHNLDDIAKKRGLTVTVTPEFAANEPIKGAEDEPKLGPAVFKLDSGATQAITDTDVPYLVNVIAKDPSHIPPLAEIHDLARTMLIRVTAETKAHQLAQSIIAKIATPDDFTKAAVTNHLEVRETGPFARSSDTIPSLGAMSSVISQAAATAKIPGILKDPAENNGNWYIFELTSRTLPNDAQWEADGPDFTKTYNDQTQTQAWVNFVNDLKGRAQIMVDPNQLAASSS